MTLVVPMRARVATCPAIVSIEVTRRHADDFVMPVRSPAVQSTTLDSEVL